MLSACLALSVHLLPGEWNAVHPCVRLESGGWVAGAFLNSERNVSFSVGREWQDGPWWLELGLATGYTGGPVVPVVRAGYDLGRARLFAAPAATVEGDIGVVLGIEFITQ